MLLSILTIKLLDNIVSEVMDYNVTIVYTEIFNCSHFFPKKM